MRVFTAVSLVIIMGMTHVPSALADDGDGLLCDRGNNRARINCLREEVSINRDDIGRLNSAIAELQGQVTMLNDLVENFSRQLVSKADKADLDAKANKSELTEKIGKGDQIKLEHPSSNKCIQTETLGNTVKLETCSEGGTSLAVK